MKKFLILILFSILIPIHNSSAVSPSLDETMEFLINGDGGLSKRSWSITDCNLTIDDHSSKSILKIDLNKVIIESIKPYNRLGMGFYGECRGVCEKVFNSSGNQEGMPYPNRTGWTNMNDIKWNRNVKALSHLFGNFCTGFKSAF